MTQPTDYSATPANGAGPGVLVLHAWWGLNDTIRAVCGRLAGAEALAQALDGDRASADIQQAVDWLSARCDPHPGGLGVIGFSLGAFFALELANADPERIRAVVAYYGTGPDDFTRSKAAFLGHFAEHDPYEPPENLDHLAACLEKAGRPYSFHVYPGTGHWFCEPDRADAYHRAAADLAWERTIAFLNETLTRG